ncbi:unnamed protein product [Tenebrio molitor]|nr:unnamed protein product [Tenebrio molitor]
MQQMISYRFTLRVKQYASNNALTDCAVSNLIPEKSKRCNKNNVQTVSENVVLAYLMEKSKTVKSSTLWSTYSMLKPR